MELLRRYRNDLGGARSFFSMRSLLLGVTYGLQVHDHAGQP